MISKFGTKFETVSKLFDHAAHNIIGESIYEYIEWNGITYNPFRKSKWNRSKVSKLWDTFYNLI